LAALSPDLVEGMYTIPYMGTAVEIEALRRLMKKGVGG